MSGIKRYLEDYLYEHYMYLPSANDAFLAHERMEQRMKDLQKMYEDADKALKSWKGNLND